MEQLLGAGVLVQIVVCAVVGVRLLLLATRTRRAPELLLAGAFLLLGVLGHPLAILARTGEGLSVSLLSAALVAQDAACLCMYATTWQTFRPHSWTAGPVIGAVALGFAVSVQLGFAETPDAGFGYYLGFTLRALGFAWPSLEAFLHRRRLEKRLRIGLADPVLVDRFRLWTISTGSVFVGFGIFLAGRLLTGTGADSRVLAAISVISVVSGLSTWLAFIPPERYLARFASPQTPA